MALTIGAILALLSVAVAVYPFLKHRVFGLASSAEHESSIGRAASEPASSGVDGRANAAPMDELEAIYQSIGTLQLERELGNVPEGLYREQLKGYRLQAAIILRDRDTWQGEDIGSVLEEEIKVARAGLFNSGAGGMTCTNCGRSVPAGAGSCQECGVAAASESGARPQPTPSEDESGP